MLVIPAAILAATLTAGPAQAQDRLARRPEDASYGVEDPKEFGRYADADRARGSFRPEALPVDATALLESRSPTPLLRGRWVEVPKRRRVIPALPLISAAPALEPSSLPHRVAPLISAAQHAGLALLIIGLTGPLRRRPASRRPRPDVDDQLPPIVA